MEKKRILIFVSRWLGTSETFIANQLRGVFDEFAPLIVARNNDNSELKEKFIVPVIYLESPSKYEFLKGVVSRKLNISNNSYAPDKQSEKELLDICKKWDIQLIHAHYGFNGLYMLPIAQKLEIPLITTFHGNDISLYLNKKSYVKSLKSLFNYPNSYQIGVSDLFKKRLIKLGSKEERTLKHYIGVNLSDFYFNLRTDKKNKPIKFLQISNFVNKKGHEFTIKAFNIFSQNHNNVSLILGGDGPNLNKSKKLVERLNIKNRVIFLGRVNPLNVQKYMQDCDIFIHNSVTGKDGSQEGIPTVIMEAMASGMPILSTRHSGIPELVKDGINGYLSEERNINDYVQSMNKIIESNLEKMSKASYKIVKEQFNLTEQNKLLYDIYKNILNINNTN